MTKGEFLKDMKQSRKSSFVVQVEPDTERPGDYLLSTSNGGIYWTTTKLTLGEMRQVAEEILRYLREEVD